ncbi:MAG TPA: SgcJ/EcaC family oxidoreductase [Chryseosolibacter sp.]
MKAYLTILLFIMMHSVVGQKITGENLKTEVQDFIRSYGSAVEQMDAQKTLDHFDDRPDFLLVADGTTYDSEQTKKLVRENFYQGLNEIKLEWQTIQVRVLNDTQAVAYSKLIQNLTDSSSKLMRVAADATFIVEKKNNRWKIIYAHATHTRLN